MTELTPTIELGDARLRPLGEADADDLFAALSDPEVTARTSYPEVTRALVEAMIARSRSRWAAGDPAKWALALAADDRLIGTCGFNEWSLAQRSAELAYDLARAHWGRGLMRRAVAGALGWAFAPGRVERVQAFVRVDNLRSERLLADLGFAREGRLRSFRVCRGERHDFHVYGLLRDEWRAGG